MAEHRHYATSQQVDEQAAAHIMQFSRTRKLDLAKEDASGNLLNEAVIVNLDRARHSRPEKENEDDDSDISPILRQKIEKLEASCKKFAKFLSDDQKARIARSPNTTEAMLAVIDSANFDFYSRSASGTGMMATLKGHFHKACASLDQHDGLLSMLPKESEYVSVFYGALNSIVAASVMHQAMATGLPKIVDELNAIVSDLAEKVKIYPQAKRQMRRVLIELYTHIFDLLARLMKWYSKNNHCWKLLKKDCYSNFQQDLQNIRTWVDVVNKGAWNNMVLEMRHAHDDDRESREEDRRIQHRFREDMLEAGRRLYEEQQNTRMQQAIQQEQVKFLTSEAYKKSFAELVVATFAENFDIVGVSQTNVLTSMITSDTSNHRYLAVHTDRSQLRLRNPVGEYSPTTQSFLEAVSSDIRSREPDSSALSLANKDDQSREDVERYSRLLDDWYPEGLTHPAQLSAVSTGQPALHESIAARIVAWVRGEGSQVLCIQLPYSQDQTSVGRDIASYVISSAWEAGHPIISHFCLLPRTVAGDRSPQTVALCEMMLSFIRQLVLLLPSALPKTAVSLDEARFASLDGTLRTWDRMLALFTDLLSLVEQSLLIVISGLQRLDGKITTPLVESFLAVIRRGIEDLDRPTTQTVKVLFVTEGQARAVVPWLHRGEYSVYEGPQRSTRPGASV